MECFLIGELPFKATDLSFTISCCLLLLPRLLLCFGDLFSFSFSLTFLFFFFGTSESSSESESESLSSSSSSSSESSFEFFESSESSASSESLSNRRGRRRCSTLLGDLFRSSVLFEPPFPAGDSLADFFGDEGPAIRPLASAVGGDGGGSGGGRWCLLL